MVHPLFAQADALTRIVIHEAQKVHSHFGPGLLEKIYQRCLAHALERCGHHVVQEKVVPIEYLGLRFEETLKLDILVDDCLVIETKAVNAMPDPVLKLYKSQCLSYMKLMDKPLGLVVNFGEATLNYKRVILKGANGWEPPQS